MIRFLPFLDLREASREDLLKDVAASFAVAFLAVPQGVAYALIAGLPPAVGLYASAIPGIVGSLFRSSRHVVSGPTNALSLLVGGVVASRTEVDPFVAGVTIAFLVGVMQALAGWLRLGALVDYISGSVVLGYITGAGVLIGIGQLGNATGSPKGSGDLVGQITGWVEGLGQLHAPSLALAAGSVAVLVGLRRVAPDFPGTVVVMGGGILLAWLFDLGALGTTLVGDIAPLPATLVLSAPDPAQLAPLFPAALAATLLSLVESSAIARSVASRTGQRLDTSVEFAGQGLSNLAAAFFGGYPVSGSPSRTALNARAGARTRMSGVFAGVLLIGAILLFGPVVDWTPVPVLAGLLLVVAVNLVDVPHIVEIFRAGRYGIGDIVAFLATLVGTWTMSLDRAILLGVGISIVLFLRRIRLLLVRELVVGEDGRLREALPEGCTNRSQLIRVLHIEGNLFFGAATELQNAIDDACREGDPKVVILRLKRTQGMDLTTAGVLLAAHEALEAQGRKLLLVGLRPREMKLLEQTGLSARIGRSDIIPTKPGWFVAMNEALGLAVAFADAPPTDPMRRYLETRRLQLEPATDVE